MKTQEKNYVTKFIFAIIIAMSLMIIKPVVVWGDNFEVTSSEGIEIEAYNVTASIQFSNVAHTGRVEISGNQLGTKVSKGYLLIKVPKDYVQAVTIPDSEGIIERAIQEVVSDQLIVRLDLKDIDATTEMSFPFNLQFIGRDTPNGYHVKPDIEYIDESDQ